jgi:hypothetical protein
MVVVSVDGSRYNFGGYLFFWQDGYIGDLMDRSRVSTGNLVIGLGYVNCNLDYVGFNDYGGAW